MCTCMKYCTAGTLCTLFRGRISYTEVYDMLRNMEPPVGFGKKCPYRLAYRVSSRFGLIDDFSLVVYLLTDADTLISDRF